MTLEVPPDAVALRPSVGVKRSTLTGQVEAALRIDIVIGVWAPGERIKAAEISSRYGVSATPAREALQRLAAEGLVILDSQRSVKVAPISVQDLKDAYEIRILLEPIALQRSIERGGPAWEKSLVATWEELQRTPIPESERWHEQRDLVLAWAAAHRRFHLSLAAGCDSELLLRLITNLYNHCERYRLIARRLFTADESHLENRLIVDAALARRGNEATSHLRRHLRESLEIVIRDEMEPSPSQPTTS